MNDQKPHCEAQHPATSPHASNPPSRPSRADSNQAGLTIGIGIRVHFHPVVSVSGSSLRVKRNVPTALQGGLNTNTIHPLKSHFRVCHDITLVDSSTDRDSLRTKSERLVPPEPSRYQIMESLHPVGLAIYTTGPFIHPAAHALRSPQDAQSRATRLSEHILTTHPSTPYHGIRRQKQKKEKRET